MADPAQLQVAQLSPAALQKVKAAEQALGSDVIVIAYEHPVVPAPLTPEQVRVLEQLESDLGVCLIAYQKA